MKNYRTKPKGWTGQSHRHALARKGISTKTQTKISIGELRDIEKAKLKEVMDKVGIEKVPKLKLKRLRTTMGTDPRLRTNEEVASAFAMKRLGGHTKNLFIEGDTIYSYGHHFPIAKRLLDDIVLFNSQGYSQSTSVHKSRVKSELLSKGFTIVEVSATKWDDLLQKGEIPIPEFGQKEIKIE